MERTVAEEIGVYAKPEVRSLRITKEHKYIVLASDGVFEFLTNDMVAELVSAFSTASKLVTYSLI